MEKLLSPIPVKRYFTIGEVSDLCGVKPYVLRYWEQEFSQLKPMKRRGNRRYYQQHEVMLVRRIRELLYEEGFTISGARNRLAESALSSRDPVAGVSSGVQGMDVEEIDDATLALAVSEMVAFSQAAESALPTEVSPVWSTKQLREELISIRALLG